MVKKQKRKSVFEDSTQEKKKKTNHIPLISLKTLEKGMELLGCVLTKDQEWLRIVVSGCIVLKCRRFDSDQVVLVLYSLLKYKVLFLVFL